MAVSSVWSTHAPSAEESAAAEQTATALFEALQGATSTEERYAALEALDAAFGSDNDVRRCAQLAAALTRLNTVSRLVALLGKSESLVAGAPDATTDIDDGTVVRALVALGILLRAARGGACACCTGITESGYGAVKQLVSCGGLALLATYINYGWRDSLAYLAVACALDAFLTVGLPRLEPHGAGLLTTRESLENALFVAFGNPEGISSSARDPAVQVPLRFLACALQFTDGAAARLASSPAAVPLLLMAMEPSSDAISSEALYPLHRAGETVTALQCYAAMVVVQLLEHGGEGIVRGAYVRPLVMNALHMLLGAVKEESHPAHNTAAGVFIAAAKAPGLPAQLHLAELEVPLSMLRALCARAAAADGAELQAARALARCNAENAALLQALLPRNAPPTLLGADLPDPMSAEALARLEHEHRKAQKRALAEYDEGTYTQVTMAGSLAVRQVLTLERVENATARARFALARAAFYAEACARAPLLGPTERFVERVRLRCHSGMQCYSLDTQVDDAPEAHLAVKVSTEGLAKFTMGAAPELSFHVEASLGLNINAAAHLARTLSTVASRCVLLRTAASWGWEGYNPSCIIDNDAAAEQLPTYDADDAFTLVAGELEQHLAEMTAQGVVNPLPGLESSMTWRFVLQPKPPHVPPNVACAEHCICSLADVLASAPAAAAQRLRALLRASSDPEIPFTTTGPFQVTVHSRGGGCANCMACVALRNKGLACALPGCEVNAENGKLKKCARCMKSAYCCRQVRACALLRTIWRLLSCTSADVGCTGPCNSAPSARLEAPSARRVRQP